MADTEDYQFDDDGDVDFAEGDDGAEWVEEEVVVEEEVITNEPPQNVPLGEDDMNQADFEAMAEDDDGFGAGDDDDAWDDDGGDDAWGDDGVAVGSTADIKIPPSLVSDSQAPKKSVPSETKRAINDNIDELNMLPMFCGVPDLTAPAVMLGIKIKQFKGISRDQLAVWGLSEFQYIGVRIKFGRWYLHEVEPPSIEIGATNHVSDVGIDLEPFRISWTLQDRCKNAFFCASDWHQNIKMNTIPDASSINDLMETTQKTYAQCLDALKKNKNNVTKATEQLFNLNTNDKDNKTKKKKKSKKYGWGSYYDDNEQGIDLQAAQRRFLKLLKKSSSKVDPMSTNNAATAQQEKEKKTKSLLKIAQSTSTKQKTKQLAEVYNIKYEVAKLAVDTLGYETASEQLMNDAVKMQYAELYQQQHPNANTKSSKSSKPWWSFGGGSSQDSKNEDDDDDDDDDNDYGEKGPFKLEYKVWSNLIKSCGFVPNYERMSAWDNDDEKGGDSKKKKGLFGWSKKDEIDPDRVMKIAELSQSLSLKFTVKQIENAMKKTENGSNDVIIDYILNNPGDHLLDDDPSNLDNVELPSKKEQSQIQKKKEQIERKKKMFAMGPCPRLTRTSSDSQIHKITTIHEAMEAISLMFEHNFFIVIINYILKQLLNSTQNCMICGEGLQYPGLKPTICLSPFCQFRLLEIGLGGGGDGGYGLGAEILGNADICDFLICCACAAAGNPQRSTIFFPEAVRGATSDTADESFMTKDGKPDVEKLKLVISKCPAIEAMNDWARQGEWSLKEELGKIHCLLYPYLIWVVTSNRALIMKLQPEQQIKEIKTPHQFVMRSQTPERAEAFNQKKRTKGSVFYAWHGSGIFNWHSILRMGLKNYSNTKFMSAGAAYGAGIYTAESSSTSLGYCTRGSSGAMTWSGSKFGKNVCCMALCEIVGPKSDWDKKNGIYVISDEACIATRYFFLFDSGQNQTITNLSANALTLPKWD